MSKELFLIEKLSSILYILVVLVTILKGELDKYFIELVLLSFGVIAYICLDLKIRILLQKLEVK